MRPAKFASFLFLFAASTAWAQPSGIVIPDWALPDSPNHKQVAQHGAGMVHLARREVQNTRIKDMEYRVGSRGGLPGGATPDSLMGLHASRIGIEKKGDNFQLWVSWQGEPMHPEGAPVSLHID